MFDEISLCLDDWEKSIPKPKHRDFVAGWKDTMKHYIDTVSPDEDELVEAVTTGLLEAYDAWTSVQPTGESPVDHERTHALMQRPQTTQRTTNWYIEFQRCLTASEIYRAFGAPRDRGTLILQKAGKLEMPGRASKQVCLKERMSPFDWGICFEPVVKLILEKRWDAMLYECGRFVHPTDKRFAASPDGLILKSNVYPGMGGHLLEIKCPKSRKIGVKIPIEYFYQMQLQLEVTEVRACEYVEVKFEFIESTEGQPVPQCEYYGKLAVVGCFCEEEAAWTPCKYVYGPVGDMGWTPDLGLNEQTLEVNTWVCRGLHHERVMRDAAWFAGLWPKLEEFWLDVEKAKRGEFTLPESTRKKKDVVCEIVDSEPETQAASPMAPEPETQTASPRAPEPETQAASPRAPETPVDPDVKVVRII